MHQTIILISLFSMVFAQIELDGKCNFATIAHMTKVHVSKLEGVWYQIEKIANAAEKGDCGAINISLVLNKPNQFTISYTETKDKFKSKENGTIIVDRNSELQIKYKDYVHNYVVLGTDYKKYLVLYSCVDKISKKSVGAWIFGRNLPFPEDAVNVTKALVKQNVDIANAAWTKDSHEKKVCDMTSAGSLQLSNIVSVLIGLALLCSVICLSLC